MSVLLANNYDNALANFSLYVVEYVAKCVLVQVQWLKQVSATDLPRTKSWDISLDCHIGKYRGVIRSKIVFF